MKRSEELKSVVLRMYDGFSSGDVNGILDLFSHQDGVLSIGTDPDEWWLGYETIARVYKGQLAEMGGIKVVAGNMDAFVEGSVGWVADNVSFRLPNGQEMPFRSTTVLHQENGEWKIVQTHLSIGVPNEEAIGKELPTE
jgi:ketosteroid isomerase-like protein